jgi:hypothetical protein
MSVLSTALMRPLAWLSNLKVAIGLLLLIALSSGIGTAIPQKETTEFYHQRYDPNPWLGLFRGDGVLKLQLDHVYSSKWFLALLALLALALILCSWRRQLPALQASLRWIDYSQPRQLSKLSRSPRTTITTRRLANSSPARPAGGPQGCGRSGWSPACSRRLGRSDAWGQLGSSRWTAARTLSSPRP